MARLLVKVTDPWSQKRRIKKEVDGSIIEINGSVIEGSGYRNRWSSDRILDMRRIRVTSSQKMRSSCSTRRRTERRRSPQCLLLTCVCSPPAGPVVRHPEWRRGNQPLGWQDWDPLHGQQLRHLTHPGQAVHERRGSHQRRRLPGENISWTST